MKVLTREEEREHYNATLTGGALGGVGGLALGAAGVYAASARYPAFRQLTIPLRAFLITSAATFSSIVSADAYSRHYERSRDDSYQYQDEQQTLQQQADAQKTQKQRTMQWLSDNRYSIVFGSWVASMGTALGLVGRNPYLTGQQKLVQARVYAQGLTVAVVIISLAFETNDSQTGKGRWETVKILDPNDPTHKHIIEKKIHHEAYAGEDQWRDMVEAEEEKIKEREEMHKKHEKQNGKKKDEGKNGKGKQQHAKQEKKEPEPDTQKRGETEASKSESLKAP